MPFVADISLYVFLIVSAILIGYYLYFFARLAFYKDEPQRGDDAPLSVIICAINEQQRLEHNVPILLRQRLMTGSELIVVNDHSDDTSRQVLEWMARNSGTLRPIHLEHNGSQRVGKKYPLSIGIREAKHEKLLLTDADCLPASDQWASRMTQAYLPGIEIVLGYGAYEKHPGWLNKIIRFETFHSALQYLSYALAGKAYMGVGRNLSYTKSLFLRHKGFTGISHLPGGDDDLFINRVATRQNTAVVIDKQAHTISTPKKTWRDWLRQKTRHYSTSKYYRRQHQGLLGLYSLSQFLFYPLCIVALMGSWPLALGALLLKSGTQYIIFSRAMKQLEERDLIRWIFLMDLWMFLYYLLFAHTLWKREKKTW